MKTVPIKLGPLALLLTVISICLTTLAVLTAATAKADMRLAEKYADTISSRYQLEAEGQRFLAEVRGAINEGRVPDIEGAEIGADSIYKTFERDGVTLFVELSTENGVSIRQWCIYKEWQEDDSIGSLWTGF